MLELREFCDTLPEKNYPEFAKLRLLPSEWELTEKISKILAPFAQLTTLMQRETISLSDFFGGWAKLKMALTKFPGDELCEKLMAQMKERERDLFNNPILNAAVFLDPRYQKFMPNENKENAISYLKRLNDKIKSLEETARNNNTTEPLNSEPDELDAFLSTIYGTTNDSQDVQQSASTQPENNIHTQLNDFNGIPEINRNESIFDYWEKNKHAKPELYKLAAIIHSVPPTQTTVERAFSAMALILSPLRTNLNDIHLENMLLVRLNRDIFESISGLT